MQSTIQIMTLIGTISTIILGVTAICLSLYFFRRAHELDISLGGILGRIQESSKVTEATSRDVLLPVIQTILSVVRDTTQSRIQDLGQLFTQKSATKFQQLLEAQTPQEKEAIRQSLLDEINALLGTLRHEVGKASLVLQPEATITARRTVREGMTPMPGSSTYNWAGFIRRIRDMQAAHNFLSVKWLREKKFAGEPVYQEALQIAIDRSMLSTYYRDNPKNPGFPTLCCKLNEDHPTVEEVLKRIGEDPISNGNKEKKEK